MTLDECEEAYLRLSKRIFQPKRGKLGKGLKMLDFLQANGRFNSKVFEDVIKECISGKLPEDTLLKEPSPSCKMYVSHCPSSLCASGLHVPCLDLSVPHAKTTPNPLSYVPTGIL